MQEHMLLVSLVTLTPSCLLHTPTIAPWWGLIRAQHCNIVLTVSNYGSTCFISSAGVQGTHPILESCGTFIASTQGGYLDRHLNHVMYRCHLYLYLPKHWRVWTQPSTNTQQMNLVWYVWPPHPTAAAHLRPGWLGSTVLRLPSMLAAPAAGRVDAQEG
jgi:hypothetical protein